MGDFADNVELRHKLRAPFPEGQIGKLPKATSKDGHKGRCEECGGWHMLPAIHLDYVGHAAVTDRLNTVAPDWTYTIDRVIESGGHVHAVMGTMTIGGKSLPETGDGEPRENTFWADEMKKAISDFIRRGAMRFGVAIDLWSKEDLTSEPASGSGPDPSTPLRTGPAAPSAGQRAPAGAGGSPQTPPADVSGEEAEGVGAGNPGKAPEVSSSLAEQVAELYGGKAHALREARVFTEVRSFDTIPEDVLQKLLERKQAVA